jgi:hypothetical protein
MLDHMCLSSIIWYFLTDVGDGGRDADLDAGVALLGQLTLEQLVQFGVENTIGNELSALGDCTLCSGHICDFGETGFWRRSETDKEAYLAVLTSDVETLGGRAIDTVENKLSQAAS